MAGATRPVQGGAYSSPRSEPGGQNTPRAGRVVASYGTYTTSLGLFWQQVDQGLIFDDTADATAIVTADGSSLETYSGDDTASGTVTASGSGTESYAVLTYYDGVIDTDNPVSHWKLGATTAATDRKGTLDLPAVNGPISTATGLITNNASGPGNTFTSTQRFGLTQATNRGVPYNTANWTIETWINPGTLGTALQYAIRRAGLAAQIIYVTAGGTLRFEFNGNGAGQIMDLLDVTAGTTYHVAATWDGTNVIAYVNGTEQDRRAITTTGSSPDEAPTIGSQANGTTPFTGTVDEAAWYPTALSAARVLAHYQAGTIPAGTVYTDTGSGTLTASGTATEAAAYTDSGTAPLTATGTGTETRSYTDTATGTATASGTGTDSWTTSTSYTDSQSGAITSSGSGTETAAGNDATTGTATSSGTGTESQTRSSAATATATTSGTSLEAASTTDAQSGSITTTGTGTDTWIRGYQDAGTGTTTASGTSTESYATDDTATGTPTLTGTGLETHADTGTGTATTTATGTGLEARAHVDSATGGLILTGTGSDDYQLGATVYTDAAAGTLTATGTGLEAHASSDSTAGPVTASGTGTETHAADDTATGQLTTSGTGVENYQAASTHTDTGAGQTTTTGTGADAYSYTDSSAGLLTLTGTSLDEQSYSDTSTAQATLTATSLDHATYTDSTLGPATLTGTGVESTLPRQLAISTITLNQPTYTIAIQNGNMTATLTAAAAPTIRIIAVPSITTSIKPPAPIAVELDRIT